MGMRYFQFTCSMEKAHAFTEEQLDKLCEISLFYKYGQAAFGRNQITNELFLVTEPTEEAKEIAESLGCEFECEKTSSCECCVAGLAHNKAPWMTVN